MARYCRHSRYNNDDDAGHEFRPKSPAVHGYGVDVTLLFSLGCKWWFWWWAGSLAVKAGCSAWQLEQMVHFKKIRKDLLNQGPRSPASCFSLWPIWCLQEAYKQNTKAITLTHSLLHSHCTLNKLDLHISIRNFRHQSFQPAVKFSLIYLARAIR